MNVDDAERLFLVAANKGEAGDVFNAGSETNVTMGAIFSATNPMVCVPEKFITYDAVLLALVRMLHGFLGGTQGLRCERRRRS
jgi:nucleoside-diphosphate-sugar epimerase